ncbi:hypothetical protein DFH06DRAFT_1324234 [Mycena polygramma]|nr:hypothetical protein DFH06DRAFT_1324234 [Mycena polygramma]
MAKGEFSVAQKEHIESFIPEFIEEMGKGVAGIALTRWKQGKASTILDSPPFATLDLSKNSRKAWFEMIVRKFTNYRNQVYLKSAEAQDTLAVRTKKANPLLKFSSVTSGRQLFAREKEEEINAACKERLLDTGHNSPAGVYQIILKEKWDGLTGEDQSAWNARAEQEAGNISQNQQEFPNTMTLALRDLCQGNLFGDAEMVLLYGFRETDTGDLVAGTIHAHCKANQHHFGGSNEEMQLQYGAAWSEFAENVIPRPVSLNPTIPRNASGVPVFPSIDLDTIQIADLRMLLSDYFDQCWAYQSSDLNVVSIPWEEIASDPGKYYDCAFSTKLDHPQNLSAIQVLQLAEGLLATSDIDSPTPFRFLGVEKVLIPASPPPAPPSSVHNEDGASSMPEPQGESVASPSKEILAKEQTKEKRPTSGPDNQPAKKRQRKSQEKDGETLTAPRRKSGRHLVPKGNKSASASKSSEPAKGKRSKGKGKWWAIVDSDGDEVVDEE